MPSAFFLSAAFTASLSGFAFGFATLLSPGFGDSCDVDVFASLVQGSSALDFPGLGRLVLGTRKISLRQAGLFVLGWATLGCHYFFLVPFFFFFLGGRPIFEP